MRFFIFLLLLSGTCYAQQDIRGLITDGQDGKTIGNVYIQNIHTGGGAISDSTGAFRIMADKGQLVEFRKLGYQTRRLRLPTGTIPPYFRIVMEKGAFELDEVTVRKQFEDYKRDSIRYAELYVAPLRVQRLSTAGKFQDPFLAMSKSRRKIWAFQEEYERSEQLRYVDYTFSERTIQSITGLKDDSLLTFRNRYRPTYEQVRKWKEYELFRYIKLSVQHFRQNGR